MRISDWSSDVCSSDLQRGDGNTDSCKGAGGGRLCASIEVHHRTREATGHRIATGERSRDVGRAEADEFLVGINPLRSEEHTSELQSLMRISYAVFCLKKKHSTLSSTHKY